MKQTIRPTSCKSDVSHSMLTRAEPHKPPSDYLFLQHLFYLYTAPRRVKVKMIMMARRCATSLACMLVSLCATSLACMLVSLCATSHICIFVILCSNLNVHRLTYYSIFHRSDIDPVSILLLLGFEFKTVLRFEPVF